MKKLMMAIVCLMTTVISVNAQSEYDLKSVRNDYKSVIPFDCAIIQYDKGKFSKVSGTITIDYNFFEELGNSMSVTVKVENNASFNVFKDVSFMICKDNETNKKIYVVNDNFGDTLFILKPIDNKMAKVFNLDAEKYVFALYNEILLEQ